MKLRLYRIWCQFHEKKLEHKKLKFVRWFSALFPGKYCWADCVSWSFSRGRFNPFRIDGTKGCEIESKEHSTGHCYCGGWQDGQCWDKLSKAEQDKIKADRLADYSDSTGDELPF